MVLAAGILLLFGLELFLRERYYKALVILSAVIVLLAALCVPVVSFPAKTLFDGFSVTGFNLLAKFLLLCLTGLVILASYDFFLRKGSVYGELSYLYLIALLRREYLSKEGAFKYLVLGAVGTSMFVLGTGLVYASRGTLLLGVQEGNNSLFALGVLLLMSALALKVSAVPFHFWTPDAYEGAPTPTTSFLATVPKLAVYFLFVKLTLYLFSALPSWKFLIGTVAVISMYPCILPPLLRVRLRSGYTGRLYDPFDP